VTVLEPPNMQALAAAIEEHPEALLVAGGTQVMRSPARHVGGRAIICLRSVEALGRVSRSQRFLDIGATATLSRVLSIGPRVVPRALFAALKATASPTVRVLATLGGNVCALGVEHTALAALAALDASIELRRGASVRTVPATLFWRGSNDRAIQAGEVLSRVRVPLADLDFEEYAEQSVHWHGVAGRVGFAAVAGVYKDAVEEFRLCVSSPWFGTLRFADFETACAGVRLPLRDGVSDELLAVLKRTAAQRLGAPMPETAPLLGPILLQAERILGLLSRGGSGRDSRRWAPPPGARPNRDRVKA
jgi:CO/xanthine dehydrogenase FAD-binding subunit